ncbi:MAG: DUF1963 domain-containing protein [Clostridia bacterium]|nr:DUF1963 domain-containing protein [Clostridia bacterium]
MKKKGIPVAVAVAIVVAAMLGVIGLVVFDMAQRGWKVDSGNLAKAGVIFAGLLITLVKLLMGMGNSRSLKLYERSYAKEIGNAFARSDSKKHRKQLLRALALYNENKYDAALKLLDELEGHCDTRDDYCAVLLFRAICYAEIGHLEVAVKEYESLLRYNEKQATAWSNLGNLKTKLGKRKEALECYENALRYDPENAYAHNNLAQAYLADGEWLKVIAPAERALELKDNLYPADSALAIAYHALGNSEKSKRHFDRAVMGGSKADNIIYAMRSIDEGKNPFGSTAVKSDIDRAIGFIQRDTARPMVRISLPAPEDGNKSRFGGAPVDENVPLDSNGKKMHLLAAIWCSEIHGIPDFPEKGVLRFYIADNDCYGLDFDNPTAQKDFRVLYDEDEDKFDECVADDPEISENFPVSAGLHVRLTPTMSSMLCMDYGFEDAVNAALRKAGIEEGLDGLSDEDSDLIYEKNSYGGHRVGGYPCFEQADPRECDDELKKYDVLLLQIVSHAIPDENGHEKYIIMFGDEGGCQFFIPREKLRNRDFSDILYNWDCG